MSARSRKPTAQPPPVPPERAPAPVLKAISMKTPGAPVAQPELPARELPQVKLRSLSEVTKARTQNLGRLAPPRDPGEVRARRVQDYVVWGSLSVVLACAIALGVWFLAR
jgi:hypothetical protein